MSNKAIARHEAEMARINKVQTQKRVQVFSRRMIDEGIGRGGVLISIIQPEGWGAIPNRADDDNQHPVKTEHWRKVLTLRFVDSTPAEISKDFGMFLFTEEQADQVWAFIKDVQPEETINIHCTAGVSRSVAVGVVVSEVLERSLIVHTGVGTRFANPHVLALLKRKQWNEQLNG
jgi:hypothetical protein